MRADAPDRISIPGVNGPIELRNIPYGAAAAIERPSEQTEPDE